MSPNATEYALIIATVLTLLGTLIGVVARRGDTKLSAFMAGLTDQVEEQNKTIKDIKEENAAKDERIDTLYARIGELRTKLDALTTEIGEHRRENEILSSQNRMLRQQLAEETQKRESLERRVDDLDAANIVLCRELLRHNLPIPRIAMRELPREIVPPPEPGKE